MPASSGPASVEYQQPGLRRGLRVLGRERPSDVVARREDELAGEVEDDRRDVDRHVESARALFEVEPVARNDGGELYGRGVVRGGVDSGHAERDGERARWVGTEDRSSESRGRIRGRRRARRGALGRNVPALGADRVLGMVADAHFDLAELRAGRVGRVVGDGVVRVVVREEVARSPARSLASATSSPPVADASPAGPFSASRWLLRSRSMKFA